MNILSFAISSALIGQAITFLEEQLQVMQIHQTTRLFQNLPLFLSKSTKEQSYCLQSLENYYLATVLVQLNRINGIFK